jgi:hypothetical protein
MTKPLEMEELKALSETVDEFYKRGLVGVGEGSIQVKEDDFERLTVGRPVEAKEFHGLKHASCDMGGFNLTTVLVHKRRT